MEVEKKNVQTLKEEKTEAEAVFQNHIQELEMAIEKHVTANEELHSQLDRKEDLAEKARIASGDVDTRIRGDEYSIGRSCDTMARR